MKLSRAIREGAKLHPQGFGAYFTYGGTCAIGAALCYLGIDPVDLTAAQVQDVLEQEFEPRARYVAAEVYHRNDVLHETREAIADWLESEGI